MLGVHPQPRCEASSQAQQCLVAAKQLAGFGSKVQQLIGGSLSAAGLSVGSRTANGKTKAAVQQPTGGKTNSEAKVPQNIYE